MADGLASLRGVLDALRDMGCVAWLTADSLMAVEQEGDVGGPGEPLTVAYLADRPGRVSALQQSFRLTRSLRDAGLHAEASGDGRCAVRVGEDHHDLLTLQPCWRVADGLVLWPRVRLPAQAVLPAREVEVDGVALPVPAEPHRVLTALYGVGWRTQQPPYRPRPGTARAVAASGGGFARHRRWWERFYQGVYGLTAPDEPSSFARWVLEQEERAGTPARVVVDAGCGNGRDTALLADGGRSVVAFDYAGAARATTLRRVGGSGADVDVRDVDLYDLRSTLLLGSELAAGEHPVLLYARFVAHALEDDGRDNLWRLATTALRGGGRMYLEFRTDRDARLPHVFEDQHFRRYLDPDLVETELKRYGGAVAYRQEGHGLAPYLSEDPHVCRMVVLWAR